ncbi:MAG: hypothetical protein IT373_01060 [Polyangiaceae bacterium]|nr:hypothetical protein [Polyangiaceae bacterium]
MSEAGPATTTTTKTQTTMTTTTAKHAAKRPAPPTPASCRDARLVLAGLVGATYAVLFLALLPPEDAPAVAIEAARTHAAGSIRGSAPAGSAGAAEAALRERPTPAVAPVRQSVRIRTRSS